jgi:hypothetical protein
MLLSPILALATLLSSSSVNGKLDPAVHRQLLLEGRPQVGLWQALHREAKLKAEQVKLL